MYCSLANILSLFEWNLDHYLVPTHNIKLEQISIIVCRLNGFIQYLSLQCSAYFLSWMCIDRFVSVIALPGSLASRLPFSTARSAHFWSIFIIIALFSINSHLFILNGFYDPPEWRNMSNQTAYVYQNPDFHCGIYWNLFKISHYI